MVRTCPDTIQREELFFEQKLLRHKSKYVKKVWHDSIENI